MPKSNKNLAAILLKEHFGSIVSDVASVLMNYDSCPLRMITIKCKQKPSHVKRAMVTLMQHQFVECGNNTKGFIEYRIDTMRVLTILRYPKYIYAAKMLYGDEGEYVIEELLKNGQLTMSDTIQRVVTRMAEAITANETRNLPLKVYNVFTKFVETRFIQRSKVINENTKNDDNNDVNECSFSPESTDLYLLPSIKLNLIRTEINDKESDDVTEPKPKRRKKSIDDERQTDNAIYWRINIFRFHQYLRDQMVIEAIKNHYDDVKAAEITRIIMRLSETKTHPHSAHTTPLYQNEIIRAVIKESVCTDENDVKLYLKLFSDDINNRFIGISEEATDGGMYCVNIMRILDKLLINCLSSIIHDRFGLKCARIFRLLYDKKYLQQKQIEEYAMVTAKDAKQLTYTLFSENIIKVNHCPKTNDYHPSRTFFLFTVDTTQVSHDILHRCYHGAYSAITRRLHDVQQHKALLDRKNFSDALIAKLQHQQSVQDVGQQIQDIKESFSSHENEILEKVNRSVTQLEHSELNIDDTIFLIQIWLFMNRVNSKDYIKVDPNLRYDF